MKCLLLFLAFVQSLNVIGWFIRDSGCGNKMNSTTFSWEIYTHVVTSSPVILANGTAVCNKSDTFLSDFVTAAHFHKREFIWRDGMLPDDLKCVIFNNSCSVYRKNYLGSINTAITICNIDGIELDWEPLEPPYPGYVTADEAVTYGLFLKDLRNSIGPNRSLGFNMGVYGDMPSAFPLMLRPWADVETINSPVIDYVNAMSYHWYSLGTIIPWEKDMRMYSFWGINVSKVNIGIPYYNLNGTFNEPLWCNLSDDCVNIAPRDYVCRNITIVSKQQNYNLGRWITSQGFGGALPWAANYNSLTDNNSLVKWLYAGITSTS